MFLKCILKEVADHLNDSNYQKVPEYGIYPVGKCSLLSLCINVTAQLNDLQWKHSECDGI